MTQDSAQIGSLGGPGAGITQALIDEKNDLERALFAVQEALQTSTSEKEQMHKLFNDFKSHFTTIQDQCNIY